MSANGNWPEIKINGYPVDTSSDGYIEEVVVDDDLNLPTTFAITLRSVDDSPYRIGHSVEISPPIGMIEKSLVKGEITTITGDYDERGRRIHMRGYDVSHRLHRGRQTRTFANVTDADICRGVASDAGIEIGTIDPTDTTHEHVSQANQSDWEFLKTIAKGVGFLLDVDEGKLNFKKPTDSADAPDEGSLLETMQYKLVYGQGLLEYRPRISSAEQVSQVEVRGWDRENKRELVGQALAGTTAAQISNITPGSLAQPFGSPTFVRADHPGETSDEIDAAAKSLIEHIGGSFAEAEGMARGDGDLRAGTAVNISGVADVFSGRFVLSHTRHVFNSQSYRTHFEISGQQRRSLLGLVTQPSYGGGNGKVGSGRIYGVVTAVVTGNDDPGQQGRVKVKMPWLAGNYESYWAPVVHAGAGPNSGSVYIPEVDDEVLVAFENGDVGRPYVLGGLYNGKDKPKLGDGLFDNGKVKRRGFISRKGHQLVFFDADGKSGIALLTSDNKIRVSLDESGRELHVYGDTKVVVESAQEIDIKSEGTLNLQSKGKMTIKSDSVVDIDGSVIQLN
ncbi:MAG TPA: VgrG-related protein [Candidatus Limnocylindrales bacterium]